MLTIRIQNPNGSQLVFRRAGDLGVETDNLIYTKGWEAKREAARHTDGCRCSLHTKAA